MIINVLYLYEDAKYFFCDSERGLSLGLSTDEMEPSETYKNNFFVSASFQNLRLNDRSVFVDSITLNGYYNFRIDSLQRKIIFGPFDNILEAGKFRRKLSVETNLYNSIITNEQATVADLYNQLLTVGLYKGKSALYKFDLVAKKRILFWEHWNRRIIDIKYSGDMSKAFVLCVTKTGEINKFPHIFNMRLILIDLIQNKIDEVYKELDLLEAAMYWNNKTSLVLEYNKWDLKDAKKVNRYFVFVDLAGYVAEKRIESFDLTKDGYPKFGSSKVFVSFSENKFFYYDKDIDKWVYALNGVPIYIFEDSKYIIDCLWNYEETHMVFSTLGKGKDVDSVVYRLYYFDEAARLSKLIYADSLSFSFEIRGDYIVYDEGIGIDTKLKIYDLRKDSVIFQYSEKNGVGLKNLKASKKIYY